MLKMKLKRWFSSSNEGKTGDSSLSTVENLNETFEMLERKKLVLQNKISIETERAKEFTKFNNKTGAIQCMKRKLFYESQAKQLGNIQLQVHDQMRKLNAVMSIT